VRGEITKNGCHFDCKEKSFLLDLSLCYRLQDLAREFMLSSTNVFEMTLERLLFDREKYSFLVAKED
jgi:hypothetical protein